jgi:protein-disulfide isomerase
MTDGKDANQQRPEESPSANSTGGARRASTRTLAIAGGVIVLVVVAVVLVLVLTQKNSSGSSPTYDGPTIGIVAGTPAVGSSTNPNAALNASDVESLLSGIPQKSFVLGNPSAPVTLVEWVDVQCPYCRDFDTITLPSIIEKYVRQGKVKVELHVWNIIDANDGGDDSLRGQKAVNGAARQDKAFNYISVLYWNQGEEGTGWLDNAMVSTLAGSVDGLNTSAFETDANSSTTAGVIQATDSYAASQPDFTGTPVILLAKGTEKPQLYGVGWGTPPMDTASLEAAIDNLLK